MTAPMRSFLRALASGVLGFANGDSGDRCGSFGFARGVSGRSDVWRAGRVAFSGVDGAVIESVQMLQKTPQVIRLLDLTL